MPPLYGPPNNGGYGPPQQYGPPPSQGYSNPSPQQPSLSAVTGGGSPAPLTSMPGRMVQSEEEIRPNEVPMDGSIALFLKGDLSCIYAKQWTRNGTIENVKYIPEPKPATATTQFDTGFEKRIMDRLDQIEKQINRKPHYNKPKPKKEETT